MSIVHVGRLAEVVSLSANKICPQYFSSDAYFLISDICGIFALEISALCKKKRIATRNENLTQETKILPQGAIEICDTKRPKSVSIVITN